MIKLARLRRKGNCHLKTLKMKKIIILSIIFIVSLLTSCGGSTLDAKVDLEYLEEDLEEIEESGELSLQEIAVLRYVISLIPLEVEGFMRENAHLPIKELEEKVLLLYDDMTYRDILEKTLKSNLSK